MLIFSGHETVCGQTVTELIELLGLPDFLDGIVATARGYICDALGSEAVPISYEVEGFFDTIEEIIEKLFQLGQCQLSRQYGKGATYDKFTNGINKCTGHKS